MKCRFLTLAGLLFLSTVKVLMAQPNDMAERCHVHHGEERDRFQHWISQQSNASVYKATEIYRIPVVIHVLHMGDPLGSGDNLSKERIKSQIKILNEDFRRMKGTRGYNEHPDGADAKIEFVLAKSTAEGEITDGIVRVDITQEPGPPFGGSRLVLGAYYSMWDPDLYFNIWTFPGVADFGLGEARFPVSDLPGLEEEVIYEIPGIDSLSGFPVNQIDGIVVTAAHFGLSDLDSRYNLGRTATHETGHFLGLFHIWGDNGFEGSCEIDDYCEDTPPTSKLTNGCPGNIQACDGRRAMVENYMDYSDDGCMNIFTQDQVARMRTVLENSPRRKSLLSSPGLLPPLSTPTDPDLEASVNIYPNPANEQLNIQLSPNYIGQSVQLDIHTISGKLLRKEIYPHLTEERLTIPVSDLAYELVFLRLKVGMEVMHKKILLQHPNL